MVNKTEPHDNERKVGWQGVDPLKAEICYHCDKVHSIKYMDDDRFGICHACVRDLKRGVKK